MCIRDRYNKLISRFKGVDIPGTGVSIGVDRLLYVMMQLNQIEIDTQNPVIVCVMDEKYLKNYYEIVDQLRENNIKRFFGYIYGFDSGFGFKPGTGMQKEFLRETSLLANEVIMVGDSMADIDSGNKIGMTTVAVLTGPLGRSELEKKADIVLNSISEIPSLLKIMS